MNLKSIAVTAVVALVVVVGYDNYRGKAKPKRGA